MQIKYIFLFLIFSPYFDLSAQVAEREEDTYEQEEVEDEAEEEFKFEKSFFLGTNFQLGLPQGKFGENVNYTGWGFGGNVMWKLRKNTPLYMGVDFSFQNYDFQSVTEITFNLEEYETRTKNSIVLSHAQFRFYPEIDFPIHPYIEGLIGVKSLLTRTILTDKTDGIDEQINSQFENSDFAMSLGGAIGFEIPINKNYLFLDVRCSYLKGASGEYYARKEDDSNFVEPIDVFELRNSATDLFIPQIGIKVLIGFGNQNEEEYYEENYDYDEEEY